MREVVRSAIHSSQPNGNGTLMPGDAGSSCERRVEEVLSAVEFGPQRLLTITEATDEGDDGVVYRAEVWQEQASTTLSEAKIVNVVISKRHDRTRRPLTGKRFGVYNFADRTEALWADDPARVHLPRVSRTTLRGRLEQMTRPLSRDEAYPDA